MSDVAVPDTDKALLDEVSLRVHRYDEMYRPPSGARHYLSVGLSAIRCIEHALERSHGSKAAGAILDFPCGYGRVLRFLRVKFPEADITAGEINPAALDFCRDVFSVKSVMSDVDFRVLSLPGKFDLIWCGSLITHIDEVAAADLLKFFYDHLAPGGLCVFTTHGRLSVERIETKTKTYELTASAQQEVLSRFHEGGYGYADYRDRRGYGISVVSRERMLGIARGVGQWDETSFVERGWDDHHDVFGFTKAAG